MGKPDDDDSKYLVTKPSDSGDSRDRPSSGGPANRFFLCAQCTARFRNEQAMWEHFESHSPRLREI